MAASPTPAPAPARNFHRVLLKLSGEALSGDQDFGIDQERIESLADEIADVRRSGVELSIVVGGGNIIRGMERAAAGMDRSTADYAAKLLPRLTHLEAIERGLKVMDTTALSLCMDNKLPIYVFGLETGNIGRVLAGERVGTIISTPGGP